MASGGSPSALCEQKDILDDALALHTWSVLITARIRRMPQPPAGQATYAAGSMPLAVLQEDFLVSIILFLQDAKKIPSYNSSDLDSSLSFTVSFVLCL